MTVNGFELDCYVKPQDAIFKNVEIISFEKEEIKSSDKCINCICHNFLVG